MLMGQITKIPARTPFNLEQNIKIGVESCVHSQTRIAPKPMLPACKDIISPHRKRGHAATQPNITGPLCNDHRSHQKEYETTPLRNHHAQRPRSR